MNSERAAAFGTLVGTLLVIALASPPSAARGDQWPDDIQFASSDNVSTDCDSGSACEGSCCCNSNSCCGCGCGDVHFELCDELMCRMEACTKSLANCGVTYSVEVPQFYQGVTSGGGERGFEYGGKVDQFIIVDSTKLGLWQGMTMTMHVETRFGDDVNGQAVGLAPVNVAMLYPKEGEHDTAITNLSFAQAVSDDVQLTFGKFNSLDLFYGLYPQTGRGVNGFMNASMVIPITVARVAPLSFMGAGAMKYHGKQIQGAVLVYDTQNCTTTSGFDDLFDNGANILGYWRFFTNVGGLPGSQGFAGIWSTGDFVSFDPTGFAIVPGQGIVAVPTDGAYTLAYILEQTLWMDCCNQNRNIALLSQWGLADEQTSPFSWSANVGIQATGFLCPRPADSMGVGYFYTGLSDDFTNLLSPMLTLHDINGVELYYNAAVAKSFNLTTDLQVIEPADVTNDTAVVFGLRGTVGL
jgi:porin